MLKIKKSKTIDYIVITNDLFDNLDDRYFNANPIIITNPDELFKEIEANELNSVRILRKEELVPYIKEHLSKRNLHISKRFLKSVEKDKDLEKEMQDKDFVIIDFISQKIIPATFNEILDIFGVLFI